MSEQIEGFVDSQIDKLRAYCPTSKYPLFNLGVTYFSQRDNYTYQHRSCNSSSNAMYLDWLRRATYKLPLPGGTKADDSYLRKVLETDDTIQHYAQTAAIKAYGFSTKWVESDAAEEDRGMVRALLRSGFPVVVNILHRGTLECPRGGHVICLIGTRSSGTLIAHDPYGTLESDYQDRQGAYSKISAENFASRWQGGFRVLA